MKDWKRGWVPVLLGFVLFGPPAYAAGLVLEVAGKQHVLEATDILKAEATFSGGQPAVSVRFNAKAATLLCSLTQRNLGKKMKMLVDGKVVIDAVIQTAICGGAVLISGAFTVEQTRAMARQLK